MKTKCVWLLICLLQVSTGIFAENRNIKGNGHVISKTIPITDYDAISVLGYVEFEYEQSDAAPYLQVELDENLFDYITVQVEGKKLQVGPKICEGGSSNRNSYNLNPTKFKVKSNSRGLKDLNTVGSGDFSVTAPLKVNKLEINQAGSGSINFRKLLEGTRCDLSLAGSGNIIISQIKVESLDCSLAGSGDIQIKGTAERAEYSVAASGEINAFGCEASKVNASVAGSGGIQLNAHEQLDASVVGSGSIRYKGNPVVSKEIRGSGSIKSSN